MKRSIWDQRDEKGQACREMRAKRCFCMPWWRTSPPQVMFVSCPSILQMEMWHPRSHIWLWLRFPVEQGWAWPCVCCVLQNRCSLPHLELLAAHTESCATIWAEAPHFSCHLLLTTSLLWKGLGLVAITGKTCQPFMGLGLQGKEVSHCHQSRWNLAETSVWSENPLH